VLPHSIASTIGADDLRDPVYGGKVHDLAARGLPAPECLSERLKRHIKTDLVRNLKQSATVLAGLNTLTGVPSIDCSSATGRRAA